MNKFTKYESKKAICKLGKLKNYETHDRRLD